MILCIFPAILFILSKTISPYPRSTQAGVAASSGRNACAMRKLTAC
jgi:hypothetical protein